MSRWTIAVEAGRTRDDIGVLAKPDTAVGEARLECVDVGKSLVSGDLPEQRPEVLGGVKFRRVRRQEDESKVAGDIELGRAVPGCAVKNQ